MATPSDTLARFREDFHKTAQECQRFAMMCRSSRLQQEHADKLNAARANATTAKDVAIKAALEDEANELLAYEFMLDALRNELEMYVALKRDDPGAAWTHLVNAQMAAGHAVQAHAVAAHLEQAYIPRLHVAEQLLFPKQMFMSVGMIVEEAACSICDAVYGECDHLKGRPYMGRMCVCIIKKSKLLEVSFVEDPANKHCRVLSVTDSHGTAKDPLSLEPVQPMEPGQAKAVIGTADSLDG